MRTKIVRCVAITAALAATAGSAWAGQRQTARPFIFFNPDGSGVALGSIGDARNSANPNELLACTTQASRGTETFISCTVIDAAGTFLQVWSGKPVLVEAINGAPSDAFLHFIFLPTGQLTDVIVTRGSQYAPKLP